ncbi:GNAT family protein [Streptomyces sp. NPDC001832]|uniref:GNAT family N-acetyltransferase n=1 Tax=Streptomyces sp. NPDC001832 TaxID=3154527 RepID=UPI003332312C
MIHDIHRLDAEIRLRPATPADAASLAVSLTRSRAYMQPWEPVRPDAFYTEQGQRPDNVASQRVLAKCGFEQYGMAPRYLHINGEWRDHRLFQRILHDGPLTG